MADTQIRGLGTGSAPLSYTVPGAQEIILKSLFASFNGAAAGGSFLPCVRIVAPGGGVVAEYVTDSPIAAGGSAEVSFAPFLRTQRSSPPGTLLETIAVTAGGNTNIVSNVLVQIIPAAVVTFTVPPSGQVLARLGFAFGNSTNTNNYMGFVDGAGTEVHTKLFAGNVGANPNSYDVQAWNDFFVTGLTPDTSLTWFAAAATNGGTMVIRSLTGIGTNITIEVWAA